MYHFKLLWLHTIQKHALLDLPLHCFHFQYFPPLLHTWFLANSGISRSLSGLARIQVCSPCAGLSGSDYDTSSYSDSSSLLTARCNDTWIEMAFLTIQWYNYLVIWLDHRLTEQYSRTSIILTLVIWTCFLGPVFFLWILIRCGLTKRKYFGITALLRLAERWCFLKHGLVKAF